MNQNAIRYGGFMGLALVLVHLVLYLISIEAFFRFASPIGFLIYTWLMVKAGLDERKELGGFITFSEAFKITFQVYVLGSLIIILFSYVLFNFIDPNLVDEVMTRQIKSGEWWLDLLNAPEEAYDDLYSRMESQPNPMSLKNTIFGYFLGLIWGAFIGLIISLFIKRQNPDELPI